LNGAVLTEARLRPQVAGLLRLKPGARFLGFFSPAPWSGPDSMTIDGKVVRVAYCPSVLAVREALCAAEAGTDRLALLTPRPADELGQDVLARLERRRLLPIESWDVACSLFGARSPDPQLTREKWLPEALIEAAPIEGYTPVPGAVLDADSAWRALLQHKLGVDTTVLDLEQLLRWAAGGGGERLRAIAPELRQGALSWLGQHMGPGAASILQTVEAGHGTDAVALGLVVRVLATTEMEGVEAVLLRDALVRLEPRLGGHSLKPEEARAWAAAAERILMAASGAEAAVLQEQAARLLRELRIDIAAHLSPVLPAGGEQRMQRLAEVLRGFLAGPTGESTAAVEVAAAQALEHVGINGDPNRRRVVEMACRIVRRLEPGHAPPAPQSLHDAVVSYATDGAYLDRARAALADGDALPGLNEAAGQLVARVREVREAESRAFAGLLAGWLESGSDTETLFGVEAVIDRVIAPLAKQVPVLVVVIDGLDLPSYQGLAGELVGAGWVERAPGDRPVARYALATVPSVTEISRTSLLCGRIMRGTGADESQGFASHPALVASCTAKLPPVLFHKADLGGGGTVGLDAAVRSEIDRVERRIVGVVVNAVDDHLAKGDQVRVTWGLDTIGPLRALVECARQAGRALVLLSDHGHVVDRGAEYRRHEMAGARWRSAAAGAPSAEEVVLRGPRVVSADGGPILGLWSERLRYSGKHNGYHGGASPQEMVVPAAVFTLADAQPKGWDEVRAAVPSWWDRREIAATVVDPAKLVAGTQAVVVPPAALVPDKKGQFDLLARTQSPPASASPVAAGPTWIGALLTCATYRAQQERHSRIALPDERMRELLAVLDARGGKLTQVALARSLRIPSVRLPGILAAARRLLNLDGYDVLAVDTESETVEINLALLRTQFGLDAPEAR
jgi:hypothetical protein